MISMPHCFILKFLLIFISLALPIVTSNADVVINEIHYNPPDDHLKSGSAFEFVEIFNPSDQVIDLSGYLLKEGIDYAFPQGTRLNAGDFLVIAQNPKESIWRSLSINALGPYQRKLSNSGERLLLQRPDGVTVDAIDYSDDPPWPLACDGYGSSLERISGMLPTNDPHSWRASYTDGGTPGHVNSVDHESPYPLIVGIVIEPSHPKSNDDVHLTVELDAPDIVQSVQIKYENASASPNMEQICTPLAAPDWSWHYWKGTSSPSSGLGWTQAVFNDEAWPQAPGGFGYGDTQRVRSLLDDMRGRYSTLYLRRAFRLNDHDLEIPMQFRIHFDDGFIAYINGHEIARNNAPSGDYTHASTSPGSHESNTETVIDLASTSQFLNVGENTLAIIGFNRSLSDSSDFVLAPSLCQIQSNAGFGSITMTRSPDNERAWTAVLPAAPSQSLIRARIEITLADGAKTTLPHAAEPSPFLSYFVYEGEIESPLPILWLLQPRASSLLPNARKISAVMRARPGESTATLYEGALVLASASQRLKARFLKGAEFNGDRTINIIPEAPTGGTNAGISSPYREHIGFWLYREMGVLSPWAKFFRVIALASSEPHTQRLVVQQVNENFLEMNGRDPDSDLYKLVYSNPNWEKHTNKDEGTESIQSLLAALQTRDPNARRQAMEKHLRLERFQAHSAASIFASNWDGYWNNNWMARDPASGLWEIIPWDLDWVWGSTPPPNTGPMYWEMPLRFPIDGIATGATHASRPPGPITAPLHMDEQFHQNYLLKLGNEFNQAFSIERVFTAMDETRHMLLTDLRLIREQTGRAVSTRESQIEASYNTLKQYTQRRRSYLESQLPVQVQHWELH